MLIGVYETDTGSRIRILLVKICAAGKIHVVFTLMVRINPYGGGGVSLEPVNFLRPVYTELLHHPLTLMLN